MKIVKIDETKQLTIHAYYDYVYRLIIRISWCNYPIVVLGHFISHTFKIQVL